MRLMHITYIPKLYPSSHASSLLKACRNDKVRKEVAAAIIKAITNNEVAKAAEIPTENVVVSANVAKNRKKENLFVCLHSLLTRQRYFSPRKVRFSEA